ncbi:MAG: TRAP transporter small permease [Betaproteobacteria bacterium]|nr:TRAP transporter small permease [Betaproteobacteria bacterium]
MNPVPPAEQVPAAPVESRALRSIYAVLGCVMLAGVLLNLANVIGRYAFAKPIFWAEEVLVALTIWGVFLGAAVVTWRADHLNMDLFSSRVSGSARLALNAVIALTLASVCAFIAWQSFTIVQLFAQTEAVSAGAQIPKVIPHSALLVGFSLSALAVLIRWRRWVFGSTSPSDPGTGAGQ